MIGLHLGLTPGNVILNQGSTEPHPLPASLFAAHLGNEALATSNLIDAHGSYDFAQTESPVVEAGLLYASARKTTNAGTLAYFSRASEAQFQFGTDAFWICMTFRTETVSNGFNLLGKWGSSNALRTYRFQMLNSTGIKIQFGVGRSDNVLVSVLSSVVLANTTWYTVVGFHDPEANVIGVKNGAETTVTTAFDGGLNSTDEPIYVGRSGLSTTGFFGRVGPIYWGRGYAPTAADLAFLSAGRTLAEILGYTG